MEGKVMPPEIWAIWPSANPELADAAAKLWKEAGYKTAVLIDKGVEAPQEPHRTIIGGEWKGFPDAINRLCREVPGEVVVCIGDDIHPPQEETPAVIYDKFRERFPDWFGVMQPTGDRFGSIDLCCPCPWVGRRFIEEAYKGKGPYWPGYFHYFSDQEIQDAAILLGAFQQRSDLTQYHDHWQRDRGKRPVHLGEALKHHRKDKVLYAIRKRANFPGHKRENNGLA